MVKPLVLDVTSSKIEKCVVASVLDTRSNPVFFPLRKNQGLSLFSILATVSFKVLSLDYSVLKACHRETGDI